VLKKDGKKFSWPDRERNEVLHKSQGGQYYPMYSKRSRAFLIGHIFRKNCLLKHFIKRQIVGRIEVKGRRGRRGKQLLNGLKENGEYWKLKKEALYGTNWRTGFGGWLWT